MRLKQKINLNEIKHDDDVEKACGKLKTNIIAAVEEACGRGKLQRKIVKHHDLQKKSRKSVNLL